VIAFFWLAWKKPQQKVDFILANRKLLDYPGRPFAGHVQAAKSIKKNGHPPIGNPDTDVALTNEDFFQQN